MTWASGLDYEKESRVFGQPHGFDPAAEVRVEIARGMRDSTRVGRRDLADGCLIARVFSRRPDPRVGLGRGWTYIWADSLSPYSASFVAEDGSPVVGQNMSFSPSEPLPATVAAPRYICSGCGRDWCVYPTDTLGTSPVKFEPE